MNQRKDFFTALIIDTALHSASIHGIQLAALNLQDSGIKRETILRVLTLPRQRRGAGQRLVEPIKPGKPAVPPCTLAELEEP